LLAQWHDIHLAFPDKRILEGVTLTVHPDDRIGLVGENGSGKTCLFRILLRELTPDRGDVRLAQGVRVGYLSQHLLDTDPQLGALTCWEVAAIPFAPLVALERQIEALASAVALSEGTALAASMERLGEAQLRFEQLGGWAYRSRIESTLGGLGLVASTWATPVSQLSAGQKVRLALARLLLAEYDLLLLDEPTNHLDMDARDWLKEYLRQIPTPYVVVSHDRDFLDAVVEKVAHLDRGKLTLYSGNYTAFRRQAEEKTARDWQIYERRQKLVRKLETQARDYKTWSDRTEKKKRGPVDKGAIGRRAAKLMKRSIQAKRRLERTIEAMKIEKPFVQDPVAIDFSAGQARALVHLRDVSVGYDAKRPLASQLTIHLSTGERLAVTGPNGSGKSAFLKTLLGEIAPLQGEVWRSPALSAGYFDQDARMVGAWSSALEAVLAVERDETIARTVMGRMRIRRESVNKPVHRLSAGERAKVLLARLMLGEHNLLVLDEPTNHLDIETQDVLLEALRTFPGGIVFVSHDRYFVQSLATQILSL